MVDRLKRLTPASFTQNIACKLRKIATSGEPPMDMHHCTECGGTIWTPKGVKGSCAVARWAGHARRDDGQSA